MRHPMSAEATEALIYTTEAHVDRAWRFPLWAWPACADLFPMGDLTRFVRHHSFIAGNLRGDDLDPLSTDLSAAGPKIVRNQESAIWNPPGGGEMECPLDRRQFKVWELK